MGVESIPYTKTTVELPRDLLARLKAHAARSHTSLKKVVVEALEEHLKDDAEKGGEPAWMELFGAFKDDPEDNARIRKVIDEEFSRIDPEAWK